MGNMANANAMLCSSVPYPLQLGGHFFLYRLFETSVRVEIKCCAASRFSTLEIYQMTKLLLNDMH